MSAEEQRRPILIAGPTASGKSALAIRLAGALDGVIVNCDSMQVYDVLRVLTARPSAEDEAAIPHRLYGHVSPQHAYSAGQFVKDAAAVLRQIEDEGRRAILVGGTGLYFKALLEGLSPIPEIAGDVRAYWRSRAESEAPHALHSELARRDAAMAARLKRGDTQRIVRALEVIEATGVSLAEWQTRRGQPVVDEMSAIRLVVMADLAALLQRAETRFESMLAAGAVEEVEQLMAMQLSASLPSMRAIGVGPISRMVRGALSREEAVAAGQQETRHYIKRQLTWLKRYMISWKRILAQ